MNVAIYARVSTKDKQQDIELQLNPLREYCNRKGWQVYDEYKDIGISGSKDRRPDLDRLMGDCRKLKVDIVLAWRMDRFGRSLKHLVNTIDELSNLGIGFVSYMENIDFTSAVGRLQMHMMMALAEFQREQIRENVMAGLENARRKGKHLGRKALAPIDRKKIIEAHLSDKGMSVRQIAKHLHMKPGSVHKTLSFFKSGKCDSEGFLSSSSAVQERGVL